MNKTDRTNFDFIAQEPESVDAGAHRMPASAKVISLFAGIGGFDLAFEQAGAEVVMQCEVDRYCQAVLNRHWPKTRLESDITKIDAYSMPNAEVWTAGFPCQDVSLARGNHGRTGLKGAHTSLFFNLMELVEVKQPTVLLLENVVGLLNSHKGCDFAVILNELTSRGYAVAWRVLNARYFGTPQTRSRVFLCAWRGNYKKAVRALFDPVPGETPGPERAGFITPTRHEATGAFVPEVAYCVAATSGRHTGNDWSRSYVSYEDRVRRPTPTESERLQGFPTDWTVPNASFSGSKRGLDSERYRATGNAVAVPVVRWIAERVLTQLRIESDRGPRNFTDFVRGEAPDLNRSSRRVDFVEILEGVDRGNYVYRWKHGGCAWRHSVIEGSASPAPSKIVASRFVDILDPAVPQDRYFLTPNAAVGIVRRADSVGRTLFPPMRAALDKMAASLQVTAHESTAQGSEECLVQLSSD